MYLSFIVFIVVLYFTLLYFSYLHFFFLYCILCVLSFSGVGGHRRGAAGTAGRPGGQVTAPGASGSETLQATADITWRAPGITAAGEEEGA